MKSPSTSFLKPVESRRAFEEILHQLEQAIVAGHIAAGDRLPPERELADRFRVSRTSVREALRVLEALGVVRVRRGADNGATLLEEPGNAFVHLFNFQLALEHISVASLVEFRTLIESWAAATVARRHGAEVAPELERLVAQMGRRGVDPAAFHELDAAFHLELVRAAGNELVTLVLEGARSAIARVMLEAITSAGDWPATQRRLVREHRAVCSAIRERRPEEAAKLIEKHIRDFYDAHLDGVR
jgi:GntR family transcriptional repressor for pyruvate dehydrogenase complex